MNMFQHMPKTDCIKTFRIEEFQTIPQARVLFHDLSEHSSRAFAIGFNAHTFPAVFIHILNKCTCAGTNIQVMSTFVRRLHFSIK